ncbi:ankyrin repeat domain-containing protein [Pseudoxanthomonas daejeonensis]|uniref:ankyrin repeat domain-containing protein n=1 Tax=Pseudoxanthomonas daejeonensis TaxID=266062 RepID=UPI0013914C0D|nr:ankyrin repeat domain-containing protein [Pseudoxanthomonas daejeonensis]
MNERQQKQCNKALTDALQGGDLEDVEWALEQGAKLTALDRLGRPVLAIAVVHGPPGSVDLLIARGADVNARTKDGGQLIHHAVMMGNLDNCRSLLAAGADARSVESDGYTPLHWVAHAPTNRKELVDLLVRQGADIHAQDERGNTPLHNAARHSNGEVAQALLAHGADMEALNQKGEAPRQVFAKFLPFPGTLDAKKVFEAYDRQIQLQQVAQQSRPDDLDASEARVGSLADVDEIQARRGRGRMM